MSLIDDTAGTLLIYPPLGLVRMEGRVQEGEQVFYRVKPLLDELSSSVLVRVDRAESSGLRPLCGRRGYRQVLYVLRQSKRGLFHVRNQNKQYSKAAWMDRVNSADLGCVAGVVRDLWRGEGEEGRTPAEESLYAEALRRVATELSLVKQKPVEEVKEKLEQILALPSWGVAAKETFRRVLRGPPCSGGPAGAGRYRASDSHCNPDYRPSWGRTGWRYSTYAA